jgi:hypothetical protein
MRNHLTAVPVLLIAAGGLIVGLSVPAAAHEASHLINGSTIEPHSITGNRLENNTVTGKQIKESTLGEVPEAKTVPKPVWHLLKLDGSWADLAPLTGDLPAAYTVDAQGFVHLRGAIYGGGISEAFSLPAKVLPSPHCWAPIVVGDSSTAGTLLITDREAFPTDGSSPAGSASAGTVLDSVVLPPTC